MKIYLDDVRDTPDGWERFYTTEQLIMYLHDAGFGGIETISLDHDLGEGIATGYDFLVWLEERVYLGEVTSLPKILIHSDNSVGRENMKRCLESIARRMKK